jgi:hypothetical protein
VLVSTYISGAARWNAGPVVTGLADTRPIAAGTVASYRLQEAAPVEFRSVEQSGAFRPPPWMGREVTGDGRYANQALALRGRPRLA